jgi:hypothetical protein
MADTEKQILDCYNPDMKWPSDTEPGLPNVCQGVKAGTKAGTSWLKPFLPPNPLNPAIPPPFPLIQGAFMGPIVQPTPETTKFGMACQLTIWTTLTLVAVSILALSPMVPGDGLVFTLFKGFLSSVGLPAKDAKDCIPKAIVSMIHEDLGI